MHLGILETGAPAPPLATRHGRYDAMFEALLAPLDAGLSFSTFNVFEDAPPAVDACEAWLVTGSASGAYEPHDWIPPLEDFIRRAAARRPTVGVCFGHQIMAQALGGRVEKSARGWGVGVHTYYPLADADWLRGPEGRFDCAVSHQDQVIAPPQGASTIAGSNFCPNAVLAYEGGLAMSMQCHPEFEHAFALDLLEHRRASIPEDVSAVARVSLERATDRRRLGEAIVRFLTSRS
ncbi:MAG: type 1 glutamine amidotransferase [Pseudomonadota bacterium]